MAGHASDTLRFTLTVRIRASPWRAGNSRTKLVARRVLPKHLGHISGLRVTHPNTACFPRALDIAFLPPSHQIGSAHQCAPL